jgi:molecular chaperone GrpE
MSKTPPNTATQKPKAAPAPEALHTADTKTTKPDETKTDAALKTAQQQITDLTDTCKHVQADFENYRKRVERDQQMYKTQAKKDIVQKSLLILDNFHLALRTAPQTDFAKGIELIYAQLLSMLEAEGLRIIETTTYNPKLHEVLLTEKSDNKAGTILEVLQNGYTLDGMIIRTAKVKLAQ